MTWDCRGDLAICKTRSGRKRRLGAGSSSTVYRALMHGVEEVALKVIPTHGSTQQQEAQHQAEVRAQHYVNVLQT